MLGILYIALCIWSGKTVLDRVCPEYVRLGEKSYSGKELYLPAFFIIFPASYIVGTLLLGWASYLAADLLSLAASPRHPLLAANAIVMPLFAALSIFLWLSVRKKRKREKTAEAEVPEPDGTPGKGSFSAARMLRPECAGDIVTVIFFIVLFVFFTFMCYRSFAIRQGGINVGYSVFSDFATHLGMIRSFSWGNNFPTQYSHFAAGDIRYHFMFQFLAGNLEYLGLPLDHAFNFPSILSLISLCMLLFVLAAKICSGRVAGIVSVLLLVFHPSPSLFRWLGELREGESSMEEFLRRDYFFSYTPREDWGLWNFKVYLNQRHLAFGMAVVMLVLIAYTGLNLKKDSLRPPIMMKLTSLRRPVLCGLLLGLAAFWNGAMVIGGLAVLFVLALFTKDRLQHLVTAVIAVGLSFLQSLLFVKGSTVSPQLLYGFIAENPTFWGCIRYLLDLAGPLLIVAAALMIFGRKNTRILLFAFSAPLLLGFYLSLTPDVTVNHKYLMLSFILLGIPVAGLIALMLKSARLPRLLGGVLLCFILMATGIYECRIVSNIDKRALVFKEDDPLSLWVRENSCSRDVWLTDMYSNHESVLGGAMLYYGWPYYAWSAGYDTAARERRVKELFSTGDPEVLKAELSAEGIRYILVDGGLRQSADYFVREDVIADCCDLVYKSGEGAEAVCVYEALAAGGER